jgi:glucose-1-phosphatase
MIQTILFDLGNVIVPFEIERTYRALQADCGLPLEEIAERIRASGLYNLYESGQLSTEDFYLRFRDLLGMHSTLEEFGDIWSALFLPHTTVSEELIVELKERYRLVLLSNTNELHFNWIRPRYPLLRHFDAFTLSWEVQAMKPDERIFAAAVANGQCRPEECFFTDDVPRYIEGARAYGIDAEVFTGEADLRGHLERRGLL